MSQAPTIGRGAESVEHALRDDLARSDAATAAVGPALRYLLANHDPLLFSDAVVVRVRAMLLDLADQLLSAPEVATDVSDSGARQDSLAQALVRDTALLTHVHAAVLEACVTERLQARSGIDEALSPLVQHLIAGRDPELAALATAFSAAQMRFMQRHRQMRFSLAELPGALFQKALDAATGEAGTAAAPRQLRDGYDAAATRLGLLARLVAAVPDVTEMLSVERSGLAIFVTALADGAGQDRDSAVLSLAETQAPRLVLMLRATALDARAAEQQFHVLHPALVPPEGFETLSAGRARALLSAARAVA